MTNISALENGPLKVETGGKAVVTVNGVEEVQEKDAIFLCRCGGSANKPFCDGTHRTSGFEAAGCDLAV